MLAQVSRQALTLSHAVWDFLGLLASFASCVYIVNFLTALRLLLFFSRILDELAPVKRLIGFLTSQIPLLLSQGDSEKLSSHALVTLVWLPTDLVGVWLLGWNGLLCLIHEIVSLDWAIEGDSFKFFSCRVRLTTETRSYWRCCLRCESRLSFRMLEELFLCIVWYRQSCSFSKLIDLVFTAHWWKDYFVYF